MFRPSVLAQVYRTDTYDLLQEICLCVLLLRSCLIDAFLSLRVSAVTNPSNPKTCDAEQNNHMRCLYF